MNPKWYVSYTIMYEVDESLVFDSKEDAEAHISTIKWGEEGTYGPSIIYGEKYEALPFEKVKSYKIERMK